MTDKPQPVAYAPPRRRRWGLYLIATLGVIGGVLLREPLTALLRPAPPADPTPAVLELPPQPGAAAPESSIDKAAEARRLAWQRSAPQLDWADAESQRLIDEHLRSLDRFFIDVKRSTPHFAGDVLGFRSKWRLVRDKLPFTRNDSHQAYLRERFEARLFTPQQLNQNVESVIKSYIASVQNTESVMLVRLRADLADLPSESLPRFGNEEALRQAFEHAIADAANRTRIDFRSDVARELASAIAGEVIALAAVRMGVSAGILSAGAGSSWATFGVGLVVGLVIDQIVTRVWDWWTDPIGEFSRKMNQKLDAMHGLIVDGDGSSPGLRARLLELHTKRAQIRRQAIAELIGAEEQ